MLALVLIGAISAHASVNLLNEYFDFKSGLDLKTNRTPFSGGSGALPANPEMANAVLVSGLVTLLITIIIGIYFTLDSDIQILPIGLIGLVLIVTYTQWLNRLPLLCLIAPGLGFGVLMVVGTDVILGANGSELAWLVSLVPFFLINNLLLLNQYPDIEADATVGRNTFPIAFGLKSSNIVYTIFMLTTYLLILFYIVAGYIPPLAAIALLPIVFAIYALVGAVRYGSKIWEHPQHLGANVAATILTPLLLAIAIIAG
jgi:1,4-dihydroxy-2-naphthoate octaprenyltransferase